MPEDQSIAHVLLEAGIEVPLSCEQGVCGTCLTGVLEGIPDHCDLFLTEQEKAANDQIAMGHVSPTNRTRSLLLGAIQRLDLGFLVNRQHQGIIRWVQIEPDHVDYLVGEMRIVADFDGLQTMGFEVGSGPDLPNQITPPTVFKWRKRYREAGIEGLSDLPRSGQPLITRSEFYVLEWRIYGLPKPLSGQDLIQ